MKKTQRSTSKPNQSMKSIKKSNPADYLHLTNQQYLVRTLRLLGVTQQQFTKQTKLSLTSQLFSKTVINPTASKHFFYIMITCLKHLLSQEQFSQIQMWYPPRNVNQQLQFKKVAFKLIQKLETQGKVPKDMLVTKGVLMGDTTSGALIEFLRFLSELALRQLYIQKHSKRCGLIQIAVNTNDFKDKQNDINRFYRYPFVPSKTCSQAPKINIFPIKNIFRKHLQYYKQKIAKLRTSNDETLIDPQQIMSKLLQQKQLSQTLNKNIPKQMLGQNRAFDRRRIIDRHKQIWKELNSVQCDFTETNSIPVIRMEGQIDKILSKWEVGKGISKIIEANSQFNQVENLKKEAKKRLQNFQQFKKKLSLKMKEEPKVQQLLKEINILINC